jgi:cell division protease FtsH
MTTGAGNDLERATALARKMVCEWGMSDAMGPLSYGKKEEQIFLGREIAQHRDYSEHTAVEIDNEVKRIVMDNYQRAKTLIREREAVLHSLAKSLLEKETLDAADIDAIVNGQPAAA